MSPRSHTAQHFQVLPCLDPYRTPAAKDRAKRGMFDLDAHGPGVKPHRLRVATPQGEGDLDVQFTAVGATEEPDVAGHGQVRGGRWTPARMTSMCLNLGAVANAARRAVRSFVWRCPR